MAAAERRIGRGGLCGGGWRVRDWAHVGCVAHCGDAEILRLRVGRSAGAERNAEAADPPLRMTLGGGVRDGSRVPAGCRRYKSGGERAGRMPLVPQGKPAVLEQRQKLIEAQVGLKLQPLHDKSYGSPLESKIAARAQNIFFRPKARRGANYRIDSVQFSRVCLILPMNWWATAPSTTRWS